MMRCLKKREALFLSLIVIFYADTGSASSLKSVKEKITSVEEIVKWSKGHLYYRKDQPSEEALSVEEIIKRGYGDCKMFAGVVSELLYHIGVENRIVTVIKKKRRYHMFNVYIDSNNDMRVIDNGKLVPKVFDDWSTILEYYNVSDFLKVHSTYEEFRKWFNVEVWGKNLKRTEKCN